MKKNAVVLGLMLGVFGISGSAVKAQTPNDGCALLQAADLQALAGATKVGPGKPSTDGLGSLLCQYIWGTGGNVQSGRSYVNVSVTLIAKAFPGMDAALLRQGFLGQAKGPNAGVIPGVGDAAVYESNAPIRVETRALAKGKVLTVSFESSDARTKKDQVISLLKTAAGRL
jgi:hypothetical protein